MKQITFIYALILSTAAVAQTPPPAPKPPTPAMPATPAAPAEPPRVRVMPRVAVAPRAFAFGGMMSGSYLGVDVDEVTSDRVSALKLKEERGVEITQVDQDAPAGKAGLREHDVITDFNGQRVEGREQFTRFIRETPAGRTVTLGIVRDGQPMQIKATLADRQEAWKNNMHERNFKFVMPEMPDVDVEIPQIEIGTSISTSAGISMENLTPQLATYFGVKSGNGALVKSVERGSAAEKAGIKAGDVIVKVDGDTIEGRSDFRQAIRHRNADAVKVTVVRNKAEQTLTMTLPKNEGRRAYKKNDDDSSLNNLDFDLDFDTSEIEDAAEVAANHALEMINLNINDNDDDDCDQTPAPAAVVESN